MSDSKCKKHIVTTMELVLIMTGLSIACVATRENPLSIMLSIMLIASVHVSYVWAYRT
ncbi:MAG: hypothetical protein PHY30_01920 [Candidatus Pacebacteria bacterium]|nr:hypothetical protein [Candidatus Paceibacterota bacterium]